MTKFTTTKTAKRNERGVALLTALLLLLLLSALAVGMMYMTSTDAQINSNFRSEQQAYFAARAGMEEARDRMRTDAGANSISASLPTTMPGTANSVLYIVNKGSDTTAVTPWLPSYKYYDTELCHDGFTTFNESGVSSVADVQCAGTNYGSSSFSTTVASVLPFANTSAAIPFKWARITLKQNNSVLNHAVDPNHSTDTSQICWNNSYETQLTAANCSSMSNGYTPVYMITSLAVTSSGTRRMVQAEVAQQPLSSQHYGLFATDTSCGSLSLGGGAIVDAYDSSKGTYGSSGNISETGGAIGSNGNITTGGSGVSIGGNVYSPVTPSIAAKCSGSPASTPMTVNGGGGFYPGVGDSIQPITTVTPTTPTIPAAGATTINNTYLKNNVGQCQPTGVPSKGYCLSPGKYGDISLTSSTVLILAAGTYNVNSLSEAGQATVYVTGAVTLNVTGTGQTTPVSLEGGGFVNTTGTPGNFQINYAGSGTIKVTGGNGAALLVNAPNASVNLDGTSSFYGAILGKDITLQGGAQFHYDTHSSLPIPVATYYTLLSFRELYY